MFKKCLRQKIIAELIKSRELSISQLSEKVSANRVSISKELTVLKDSKIATKKAGSTLYTLSSDIAFVIFKFYQESAQLLIYSPDGSLYEREEVETVHSLSYEDNVIFLSKRIEKRAEFLKKRFERVVICIIHDKKMDISQPIYKMFEFTSLRATLTARHIEYESKDEAVLYVNSLYPISFICKDGEAVTPNAYPNDKVLQSAKTALNLIKPNRVLLEGKESDSLSLACLRNDIPLLFINSNGGLSTDERGMIEEALYKLSTTNIS